MNCTSCGKKNSEGSIFCQYCGKKISIDKTHTNSKKSETKNTSKDGLLWDKFAELYDSTGDERQEYLNKSSDEVWEVINRVSTNSFESFIEKYKDPLNKQSYNAIETIKSIINWCTSGGYWFWMAETYLEEGKLQGLNNIKLDDLIEKWKIIAVDNYNDSAKKISDGMSLSMDKFFRFEFNTLIESAPGLKDLTNEIIEDLKGLLIMHILWGYFVGLAESRYRK